MKTIQILNLCLLSLFVFFTGIAMTSCDDDDCDIRDPRCREIYGYDDDLEPCFKDKDCKPAHECYKGYCAKKKP